MKKDYKPSRFQANSSQSVPLFFSFLFSRLEQLLKQQIRPQHGEKFNNFYQIFSCWIARKKISTYPASMPRSIFGMQDQKTATF